MKYRIIEYKTAKGSHFHPEYQEDSGNWVEFLFPEYSLEKAKAAIKREIKKREEQRGILVFWEKTTHAYP